MSRGEDAGEGRGRGEEGEGQGAKQEEMRSDKKAVGAAGR